MSDATKTLTIDQLDEIHTIQRCLSAITDLMHPCDDLHIVNRDDLTLLLGYFSNQLQKATRGGQ